MTDDSDSDLFSKAMNGVTPLSELERGGKVQAESAKPRPVPRQIANIEDLAPDSYVDSGADAELEAADEQSFARSGVQAMVLRKLRRGDFPAEDQIDLHGMNASDARKYVHDFLNYAAEQNMRAVRVVHGKGHHSQQGPVLKRKIGQWLRQRDDVLAYVSANQAAGGSGALYVLLSR